MKKKNIKTLKLEKETVAILKPEIIKGGRITTRTRTTKYTVCGCVTARTIYC